MGLDETSWPCKFYLLVSSVTQRFQMMQKLRGRPVVSEDTLYFLVDALEVGRFRED